MTNHRLKISLRLIGNAKAQHMFPATTRFRATLYKDDWRAYIAINLSSALRFRLCNGTACGLLCCASYRLNCSVLHFTVLYCASYCTVL